MKSKLCKKCKKPLPEGYKYDKCESCRNKEVQKLKNTGKKIGMIATPVIGLITAVLLKKKK